MTQNEVIRLVRKNSQGTSIEILGTANIGTQLVSIRFKGENSKEEMSNILERARLLNNDIKLLKDSTYNVYVKLL